MNDITWVAESDWSKVTVGQKVRLVNPVGTVTGKVAFFRQDISGVFRIVLEGLGTVWYGDTWSLFVEAPPAVVLPTEPGLYLSSFRHEVAQVLTIDGSGYWRLLNTGSFFRTDDGHLERYAPFTKLEPVPETAEKVLDAVLQISYIDGDSKINLHSGIKKIAAEFGVEVDK